MAKCTVLLENSNKNFAHAKSAHGLSLLIEVDKLKILFDTGPNSAFIPNALLLKKNLNLTDYVVLSHSHYDHCCGYPEFVKKFRCRNLICGDKFFSDKYSLTDGVFYYKGPNFDRDFLNCFIINTTFVERNLKVAPNIYVHSKIKNTVDFEELPGNFFVEGLGKYQKDEFLDEAVVVVKEEDGLTLIVGCSHPGDRKSVV